MLSSVPPGTASFFRHCTQQSRSRLGAGRRRHADCGPCEIWVSRNRDCPAKERKAMPHAYQTILVERAEGIAIVTLNRPDALNALDLVMREELAEALYTIRDDAETRVVVLTGAGRAFCAGGDIKSMGGYTVVTGRARIKKA